MPRLIADPFVFVRVNVLERPPEPRSTSEKEPFPVKLARGISFTVAFRLISAVPPTVHVTVSFLFSITCSVV